MFDPMTIQLALPLTGRQVTALVARWEDRAGEPIKDEGLALRIMLEERLYDYVSDAEQEFMAWQKTWGQQR